MNKASSGFIKTDYWLGNIYHRHIVAKATFSEVDHHIWQMLWRWSYRRHAHRKNKKWIKNRYFMRYKGRDWTFFARDEQGNLVTIFLASDNIPICRHIKIKDQCNPYDASQELYFEQRSDQLMQQKQVGKRMITYLNDSRAYAQSVSRK